MKGFCLKKNRKIPGGKIRNWCMAMGCIHLITLSSKNENDKNGDSYHNGGFNRYRRLKNLRTY